MSAAGAPRCALILPGAPAPSLGTLTVANRPRLSASEPMRFSVVAGASPSFAVRRQGTGVVQCITRGALFSQIHAHRSAQPDSERTNTMTLTCGFPMLLSRDCSVRWLNREAIASLQLV
jgi:hypothetical protein